MRASRGSQFPYTTKNTGERCKNIFQLWAKLKMSSAVKCEIEKLNRALGICEKRKWDRFNLLVYPAGLWFRKGATMSTNFDKENFSLKRVVFRFGESRAAGNLNSEMRGNFTNKSIKVSELAFVAHWCLLKSNSKKGQFLHFEKVAENVLHLTST